MSEEKRKVRNGWVKNDAAGKTEYILTHALPSLKGVWKRERAWIRSDKEKQYLARDVFHYKSTGRTAKKIW